MMLRKVSIVVTLLSISGLAYPSVAKAQQIEVDGSTATIVTREGNRIKIDGNTLSGDGKNLFHSFQEFGLTNQQIAEFITNPNIQNILTRITGGNPSYINGLIEVTGGNSNLYLMNPAGVIFGNGASLNVPADFTATTSTSIGFANGFFNAVGTNDYQTLVGNPTNFVFNTEQPGTIVNAGNLIVSEGKNVTLVGGNVINTGTISTPQGKINIEAVAGTSKVKITPEGSLLSLEIDLPVDERGNSIGFTPDDLPTLLTGGKDNNIPTQNVVVNPTTGKTEVAGVEIPTETGITAVSGTLDTSSNEATGGDITVLGDKVALLDTQIDTSGKTGGGDVKIGGDFQGNGTIPNATISLVNEDTTIKANALESGNGGEVIVWADGDTVFSGKVEAKGGVDSGDGGFVEISGKKNLGFNGEVDTTAPNGETGTLLLDPDNVVIVDGDFGINDDQIADGVILSEDVDDTLGGAVFTISENALEALPGTTNVLIEANDNITIENLSDNQLLFANNVTTGDRTSVTFRADAEKDAVGNIIGDGVGDFIMEGSLGTIGDTLSDAIFARGRDVNISGVNITVGAIYTGIPGGSNGNAGNISLNATNDIFIQGVNNDGGTPPLPFSLATFVDGSATGNAGNIFVNAPNGSITVSADQGNINASTPNGSAGAITFNANVIDGNINLPATIEFRNFTNSGNDGITTLIADNISGGIVDFIVDEQVDLNTENLNVEIANSLSLSTLSIDIRGINVNINDNINSNGADVNVIADENIFLNGSITVNLDTGAITLNGAQIDTGAGDLNLITDNALEAPRSIFLFQDTVLNVNNLNVDGIVELNDNITAPVSLTVNATNDVNVLGEALIDNEFAKAIDLSLPSGSQFTNTGDIIINAGGNIGLNGSVQTTPEFDGIFTVDAGNINLSSTNGDILVGAIATAGTNSSGIVNLTGNTITTGPIISTSSSLGTGSGGIVNITAINTLLLGEIQAESLTVNGNLGLTNSTVLNDGVSDDPANIPFFALSNITTTGDQIYNGDVFVADNTQFTGNNISFNGDLDSFNFDIPIDEEDNDFDTIRDGFNTAVQNRAGVTPRDVTVTATNEANFGDGIDNDLVGEIATLNNLTVVSGLTNLNADSITTTGNQTYNNEVVIQKSTVISSLEGSLIFPNNFEVNNASDITLRSLTGIDFSTLPASIIALGSNLTLQTTNSNGQIFIGSGEDTQFVISNLDQLNGFESITIGESNTVGSITINEILNVNDPLVLQASDIFVDNNINGNDDASITINGAGTTTTLNADIITAGNEININDNVLIGNDITLDTTNTLGGMSNNADADININGNINNLLGDVEGSPANSLTLNTGDSNVSVIGDIGNTQPLNNLTVNADSTILSSTLVTTIGSQTFNSDIFLNNSLLLPTQFTTSGNFTAQNIDTNGQNITIQAAEINILGDLDSSGESGGNITLRALRDINIGNIIATGNSGDGGNIRIENDFNAVNNIVIGTIDSSSNLAAGGDINIRTGGNLQVIDTIGDTNVSIDATGRTDGLGGDITIDLFPDGAEGIRNDDRLPFVVGQNFLLGDGDEDEGSLDGNGTAGIITNTQAAINDGSFNVTQQDDNITIVLLDPIEDRPLIEFVNSDIYQTQFDLVTNSGLGTNTNLILNTRQAQQILVAIEKEAAAKPALIYVSFTPKGYQPQDIDTDFIRREANNSQDYARIGVEQPDLPTTLDVEPQDTDILDLLIITSDRKPFRVTVPITRKEVVDNANELWVTMSDVFAIDDNESYKLSASNLYAWLVKPLEGELTEAEISNLLFVLPTEIRFTPIAALYDATEGQFLVEKYSSGLAPSLNLNDNRYRSTKDLSLLAMGASNFADPSVVPLPAAGLELPTIQKVWTQQSENEQIYLNEEFTYDQVRSYIANNTYGIVHFGTHGEFDPDASEQSYIQLYDSQLKLDDIRSLGLNNPLVELMVLSACETAFGDEVAELGFAGLAVKSGVKSAMGSVWQVSDTGTLALMTDFYAQLKTQSTKAEALRQAQLNLLQGNVYKTEDGNTIVTPEIQIPLESLPEDSRSSEDFSHPFYWAPFTMIGNPW